MLGSHFDSFGDIVVYTYAIASDTMINSSTVDDLNQRDGTVTVVAH